MSKVASAGHTTWLALGTPDGACCKLQLVGAACEGFDHVHIDHVHSQLLCFVTDRRAQSQDCQLQRVPESKGKG